MSTAWKKPVVLWREPWKAVGARVLGRAVVPALGLWLSGVPGTPWTGTILWLWFRILIFVIAAGGVLLWLLVFLNVLVNKRVKLVCMPTGSIERPRSIQERWLRVPLEYAIGSTITVTPDPHQYAGLSEPRVTLSAEGSIRHVSLWGTKAEDFVDEANALLKTRNITFMLAVPGGPADSGKRS